MNMEDSLMNYVEITGSFLGTVHENGYRLVESSKLEELINDQRILRALQAGGVEDWVWYQDSLNDHYR